METIHVGRASYSDDNSRQSDRSSSYGSIPARQPTPKQPEEPHRYPPAESSSRRLKRPSIATHSGASQITTEEMQNACSSIEKPRYFERGPIASRRKRGSPPRPSRIEESHMVVQESPPRKRSRSATVVDLQSSEDGESDVNDEDANWDEWYGGGDGNSEYGGDSDEDEESEEEEELEGEVREEEDSDYNFETSSEHTKESEGQLPDIDEEEAHESYNATRTPPQRRPRQTPLMIETSLDAEKVPSNIVRDLENWLDKKGNTEKSLIETTTTRDSRFKKFEAGPNTNADFFSKSKPRQRMTPLICRPSQLRIKSLKSYTQVFFKILCQDDGIGFIVVHDKHHKGPGSGYKAWKGHDPNSNRPPRFTKLKPNNRSQRVGRGPREVRTSDAMAPVSPSTNTRQSRLAVVRSPAVVPRIARRGEGEGAPAEEGAGEQYRVVKLLFPRSVLRDLVDSTGPPSGETALVVSLAHPANIGSAFHVAGRGER